MRLAERSTSSSRGPQQFSKIRPRIPTRWSTTRSLATTPFSSTLRVGGSSPLWGSRTHSGPFGRRPRRASTSVTRSPLGSTTTTPLSASTSPRMRFVSSVDFPLPVAPMTCRW